MEFNYSFLKDEQALDEIRKHKWIESEKKGYEIGFATAAVDWVKNYGEDWLKYTYKNDDFKNHRRKVGFQNHIAIV